MRKHFRTLTVLAAVILLFTIGTAQAALREQANLTGDSRISSIYPLDRWKSYYLVTEADAGSDVSLALDPDHNQAPWISYFNATLGSLWVAHYIGPGYGNCGPWTTWYCEQVDQVDTEKKGWFTSIDIYPDTDPSPIISTWKVGVSYYDYSHNALKYAEYQCPYGDPCTWTISTIDASATPGDRIGYYTSMEFDPGGSPQLAYYSEVYIDSLTTYSVKHASLIGGGAGNCSENSDWQCDAVDSSILPIGKYPSLDIDSSGTVYIAYYDEYNQSLKYAYSYYSGNGNCGPGNTWFCTTIDDTESADVGLFPSIHAPINADDYVRIAYYDKTNGWLKYATGPWASGNCGPSNNYSCFYIDNMGAGLQSPTISLEVGITQDPMIAYTDGVTGVSLGLKIAGPATAVPLNTCSGTLPDWQCARIDDGGEYLDVGRYISLKIKDSGLALITYSEQEKESPEAYDLKFSFQEVWVYLPLTCR